MKNSIECYIAIIVIIVGTVLTGCKKEKATLPVLTTAVVTNITSITA
jgi:hypothetical protein